MPIRVLLVDDHRVFRQGLQRALHSHPNITVVAEASNATDAIRLASECQPDVVLLDVRMKGRSGLDAISDILNGARMTAILMLSMYGDKRYVARAIESGARGYVLKDSPVELLIHAIETVHQGKSYFSSGPASFVESAAQDHS